MVSIDHLINAIEQVQPVMNKAVLDVSDRQKVIQRVAKLADANLHAVAFISSTKYVNDLANTTAGVVIVSDKFADKVPAGVTAIVVRDAYLAYASISTLFAYQTNQASQDDIHPTAIVDESATIGNGVVIGAYSVVGKGVVIGANSVIGRGVSIDDFASIGDDCHIAHQVSIAHHSQLGNSVRIHAGASIGSEGFGFAANPTSQGLTWQRIAQLGRVLIGNDVRIGSNTCIDRGAVGDTVIGNHVIIDNLVQIAHNVHIGDGTAIAAKVGIAGSTHIGRNCIIGGAVGIAGHLSIADNVTLTGMTMVTGNIKESGVYSSGTPAMPSANWRRAAVRFRQSGEK